MALMMAGTPRRVVPFEGRRRLRRACEEWLGQWIERWILLWITLWTTLLASPRWVPDGEHVATRRRLQPSDCGETRALFHVKQLRVLNRDPLHARPCLLNPPLPVNFSREYAGFCVPAVGRQDLASGGPRAARKVLGQCPGVGGTLDLARRHKAYLQSCD